VIGKILTIDLNKSSIFIIPYSIRTEQMDRIAYLNLNRGNPKRGQINARRFVFYKFSVKMPVPGTPGSQIFSEIYPGFTAWCNDGCEDKFRGFLC